MHKIIFTSFLFFVSVVAIAQTGSGRIDSVLTPDSENARLVECRIRHIDGKTRSISFLFNGKREGVWRNYSARGIPESYEEYKADVRNGLTVNFAKSGTIENEQLYKNGKLHGTRTAYLYGTVVRSTENFKDGLLDGEKISNYENGNPQEISFYKNGKRHGVTKWFSQDNKPSIEYTYADGVLNGLAKTYTAGKVTSEGNYKNDNEDGEWKIFEDDDLLKTIIYKNGVVIKEIAATKKR